MKITVFLNDAEQSGVVIPRYATSKIFDGVLRVAVHGDKAGLRGQEVKVYTFPLSSILYTITEQ